ncbi:SpoVR family protein, partial [Mycobacterium tuberculosis]|nr:SpoVR family protein [Mycobacterium tuberculosis]
MSSVLNPRAAALLAGGSASRTSLGYAGAKYEMGLEHIEQVEVITAEQMLDAYSSIGMPLFYKH